VRNLSQASLDAISQTSGLEPVLIVRVFWGGNPTDYCDRKFEQQGLNGKLLSVSGIDDVVDINGGASSVNLTVTLDDSDGSIKNIFDFNDIHGVRVQVLQWFSNINLSDAFVIFEGVLSTPIEWNEGTRSLKFDIVSKLEDLEVGYSAEEGAWEFLPTTLVGKEWPVVFGTVRSIKPLALNETPRLTLLRGFGILDEEMWQEELNNLQAAIKKADEQSRAAWDLGLANALKASQFKGGAFFPDDPDQADQYDTAASQYYNQSSTYAEERIKLQIEYSAKLQEYDLQKSYTYQEIGLINVMSTNLPLTDPFGRVLILDVGQYLITALFLGADGGKIQIQSVTEKQDTAQKVGTNQYTFDATKNRYTKEHKGQKFVWIDGGTELKVLNFSHYYIVSVGNAQVLNVWSRTQHGKMLVPQAYYRTELGTLGALPYTKLIFDRPLSSYDGEWSDDIEIDASTVSLPNNAIDILIWAITNYSRLGIDADSFNATRPRVAACPMNFVLDKRMNLMTFCKDIAFQARCAIWLNDNTFFIRYLPDDLPATETITDSDIEVNSIVVTTTDTERVVTKFVAEYRTNYHEETSKIILRYNMLKYGTHEETYDFFAYTDHDYVAKAAEFWLIRKANVWKILKCKCFLNKLRIETFDIVEFNLNEPLVSTGPVKGIIQKATYNPDEDTIDIEAWLPIRVGEMTPYDFAFQGSITEVYPKPSDPYINSGNPLTGSGQLLPLLSFPPHWPITFSHGPGLPYTSGTGTVADQPASTGTGVVTTLDPREIQTLQPPGLASFNNKTHTEIQPITQVSLTSTLPNSFFAFVNSKVDDGKYKCRVYTRGFFNDPTEHEVYIGYIRKGSILPKDYPLAVYRTVFVEVNGSVRTLKAEYWSQPPVWVPPVEDEDS